MSKIGIIVPYRNRKEHLELFIPSIKRTLEQQKIPYEIIIVEQDERKSFNRGKLLNIGFKKAVELECTYVAFHDVDMLPVKADYSEVSRPTHMATNFDGDTERTLTDSYFGGVTLFPVEDFKKINGYSNEYWGWGFEDDDLLERYRINFPNHNTKRIPMKVNNTVGLQFNGITSYIKAQNPFDLRTYTILISFEPESIEISKNSELNEYSVFSIPGYDMGFSYDSFGRYKFQVWDIRKNLISLTTNISFAKKTVIAVTVNQKERIIKFFQDGKKVDEINYEKKLKRYSKEEYLYLGKVTSEYTKRKYFKGVIDYFAIWNHSLEEEQIMVIYKNLHKGLTARFSGYDTTHCLELCYDMKIGTENEVFDLSKNERNGKIVDCDRVVLDNYNTFRDIVVPWRKRGTFKLLGHEENGFVDNQWKHPETIKNQLRFNNEMMAGTINIQEDGLSTLRYKIKDESIIDNVHIITVRL